MLFYLHVEILHHRYNGVHRWFLERLHLYSSTYHGNVTRWLREGSLMNLVVNVCKRQRWVFFIHGEEFKCVCRTIFIKSKMLLFPYTLIILTRIFNIVTFFPIYNPFNNQIKQKKNTYIIGTNSNIHF